MGQRETELQKTIEGMLPNQTMETCKSVMDLSMKLRSVKHDRAIVVLLVSDGNDFDDILANKSLLNDMRILLILPDRRDEMVAMGHSLHPRFLSFIDSNFHEVAAVLEKMGNPSIT